MKIEKHTVQHRCEKWGRWTQEPRRHFGRSASPFGKIAEMHDNAGIHADGIRYDLVTVDGETVSCPPDGGMSVECERAGRALSFDLQCREVEEAVLNLPAQMRKAIVETYVVDRREDPRSTHEVARRLNVAQPTIQEALKAAHARISRAIYGSFQVVEQHAEFAKTA